MDLAFIKNDVVKAHGLPHISLVSMRNYYKKKKEIIMKKAQN